MTNTLTMFKSLPYFNILAVFCTSILCWKLAILILKFVKLGQNLRNSIFVNIELPNRLGSLPFRSEIDYYLQVRQVHIDVRLWLNKTLATEETHDSQ